MGKGTLLLDPSLDPAELLGTMDVLPLVTDVLMIVDPTRENLRKWRYDYDRFSMLVDKRVFLPIFPGNRVNPFSHGITRKELVPKHEFFALYESAVQKDLEDDMFCDLVEELGRDSQDVAFNSNWDLIMAQVLDSPLISPSSLHPIWQHKFQTSIRDLSKVSAMPPEARDSHILERFMQRVLEDIPSNLTVDQLLEFRKNSGSSNFRRWFREELHIAANSPKIQSASLDEKIYRDFLQLARTSGSKASRITGSLVAFSSLAGTTLGAMVGGVPGAVVGGAVQPVSSYALARILRGVWRKTGSHNWVFVLTDFRSTTKL